jgi:hypothetical protein
MISVELMEKVWRPAPGIKIRMQSGGLSYCRKDNDYKNSYDLESLSQLIPHLGKKYNPDPKAINWYDISPKLGTLVITYHKTDPDKFPDIRGILKARSSNFSLNGKELVFYVRDELLLANLLVEFFKEKQVRQALIRAMGERLRRSNKISSRQLRQFK